jgi:pimeloyl-ACP methyl ester carboxylesterase
MIVSTRTASKARSKDGTAIAYDRAGQGPAIIAVDGAISHRAINQAAAGITSLLAPRFTVFTYDRRGRGESGDTAPYAVEREVEDLAALILEAGGSAFVVGGSSGAVLALEAAAQGLPITKLALFEPPFVVDDTRPAMPKDYVKQLNQFLAAGRPGDAVELFMTKAVGIPAEIAAGMRNAPIWPAMESVARTLPYDGAVMGDTVLGRPLANTRWAAVAVPTLVMDGGASPAWLRNAARALVELLPNAERRTLEGQTHEVDPKVLAPVLEEFFAS